MKTKSILFNNEMVCAILNGRKTCTRRIAKFSSGENSKRIKKSPYQVGDILYVREAWNKKTKYVGEGKDRHLQDFYVYKANNFEDAEKPYQPSIYMPKDAARIWLKVVNIKVVRLQDMTEEDCIKEGISPSHCKDCNAPFGCDCCPDEGYNEVDAFAELWNSTIKKSDLAQYGWDANPYVWAIEFEKCDKPKE